MPFFTGINIIHDPVNGNGAKHADERIKNNIGIIITKTENIEDGKDFNKRITLEIIPIRIIAVPKNLNTSIGIWIAEKG